MYDTKMHIHKFQVSWDLGSIDKYSGVDSAKIGKGLKKSWLGHR